MGGRSAEQSVGTSYRNPAELGLIERLVTELDEVWSKRQPNGPKKDVGVITFYAAQQRELRQRLLDRSPEDRFEHLKIRVGTVDRFQGMERPIVIVSLVRNNRHGNIGFARRPERINVAFSRAQELLVIVGCWELFCQRATSQPAAKRYARVAEVVHQNGGMLDLSRFVPH